jgi:ParB family chromosome partitioning protein
MDQIKKVSKGTQKSRGSKKGLGRGLSSLMNTGEAAYDNVGGKVLRPAGLSSNQEVPIEFLVANTYQPRMFFDEDKAKDLIASVKEKGILQPLLVRPRGKNRYEIVAGERRWRAAQVAGLHQVPVVIKEMNDEESLEIAIIENVQRHDLDPIEEAMGYRRLMEEFAHTQNALGQAVGKSRSHIANMMRLLSLPEGVQSLMRGGKISMGHARALITAVNPLELAKRVVRDDLSVRKTEQLARGLKGNAVKNNNSKLKINHHKDADTKVFERELSVAIGLRVELELRGGEEGALKVHYKTLEQLDDICLKLNNSS